VNEAPVLRAMVEAGELPPLDERIPVDPYVIEPFGEIGKYGGTWHRFDTSQDGGHLAMAMYGHSPIHWIRDGLDIRGGLAKSWESNEDKTEWSLFFREGTKWSDGDDFTVDDILYWWEDMALNPDHPDSPPDWMISGGETAVLEKIDDYTLKFTFAASAPLFVERLAMWPNSVVGEKFVVPSHYLKDFHPDYSDAADFEEHDEKQDWRANPEAPVLNPWMPVEYDPGVRLVLERNPYYYAVDTEGNQLPYIDRVEMEFVEDLEVSLLKVLGGETEICGRPCKYQALQNLSVLRNAEAEMGFTSYLWDGGSGTGSMFFVNWNHPDDAKREVYRNRNFRLAMSHALDRSLIQKVVYFGTGEPTTGTLSGKAIEYHRTERGRDLYAQWRDLAVEYDPEKAMALLDEAGIVDQDDDGWRDMPGGEELELRVDRPATAGAEHLQVTEIAKEAWEAIGLKTVINSFPPEQSSPLRASAEFDIWSSWEVGDGPNHLLYPQWLVPIQNQRWAPLYGAWYSVLGTDKEGTELDKDPRERTPPREEPPAGGPIDRIQKLYDQAKREPDDDKREELVLDMIQIHVEEGPFFLGTVGNIPTIVVFHNNVGNVPSKEQLGTGGFTNPWIMVYFGAVFPEQFYFKDQ
jgi:peptide/nickel transport system substrate-binding protein